MASARMRMANGSSALLGKLCKPRSVFHSLAVGNDLLVPGCFLLACCNGCYSFPDQVSVHTVVVVVSKQAPVLSLHYLPTMTAAYSTRLSTAIEKKKTGVLLVLLFH